MSRQFTVTADHPPIPPPRFSLADVLVAATNESAPARIRNTAVGLESYASLASSEVDTSLSENVMTCASDPCGGGGTAAVAASTGRDGGGGNSRRWRRDRRHRRLSSSSTSLAGEEEEEGGFSDLGCIDGNLGVYCPCFVATVTGEEVRGETGGAEE